MSEPWEERLESAYEAMQQRAEAAEAEVAKLREALESAKALILHTYGAAEVKPREWPTPATALHRIDKALAAAIRARETEG